jgi:cytoskeletal protein RodZ
MTIEGLGKKFQEAREARNLTLDEAARMTKIRPARLAEIEADDFSQFPSLAYAKGFLLIYGKFLDVDVTPYLEILSASQSTATPIFRRILLLSQSPRRLLAVLVAVLVATASRRCRSFLASCCW